MESEGDETSHQRTSQTSDSILTIPILPPELVTEILLRIPVKALLKFKSVSKSWLALISSPEFIKSHLSLSSNDKDNNYHRFILRAANHPHDRKVCSLRYLLNESATEAFDFHYPMESTSNCFWTVGSVNGLICFDAVEKGLFIWNPSIRKYKKLADARTELKEGDRYRYGFGYDELHDDYKIVHMLFTDNGDHPYDAKVKIYSLKSDSWRQIDGFQGGGIEYDLAKLVDGKLHWITNDGAIISISLADEKLGKLEHPFYTRMKLGVLGSDLSILYTCDSANLCSCADLWVMKEYGVKESWVKIYSIRFTPRNAFQFHCAESQSELSFFRDHRSENSHDNVPLLQVQ